MSKSYSSLYKMKINVILKFTNVNEPLLNVRSLITGARYYNTVHC
jgi:hypothetical protein